MRNPARISGLGICLAIAGTSVAAVGVASRSLPAAAVSGCSAPGSPGQGGAAKSIDTDQGCDNANGQATDPASGWIAIGFPGGSSSALVDDAFQALPASPPQRFFQGKYTLTFDTCSGGNAGASPADVGAGGKAGTGTTGGTAVYSVTGDGDYPKTPPPSSPQQPIAVTAAAAGGTVICHYSLQVIGTPPAGQVVSFKNELFVAFDNGQSTQTATVSVKPFAECSSAAGACASAGSTTSTTTTTSTSQATTQQSSQGSSTASGAVSGTQTTSAAGAGSGTQTGSAAGAVLGFSTSQSAAAAAAGAEAAAGGVEGLRTPDTGGRPAVLGGVLLAVLGLLLVGASQRRRRGPR